MNGKTGVLNVYSNTWVLTPDYDTTEVITYGFLCLETGGKYGVSNFAEMIIPVESDNPYEYDYFPELFLPNKRNQQAQILHKGRQLSGRLCRRQHFKGRCLLLG